MRRPNPLMRVYTRTVTSKGQITIPASLRRAWGWKVGDQVLWTIEDDDAFTATLLPGKRDRGRGSKR